MDKKKRYIVEVDEDQLMLMSKCIEDCSRFAAGQVEMDNTLFGINCKNMSKVHELLDSVKEYVTPGLDKNESYGWSGGACDNQDQAEFIAKTYALYREIRHVVTCENHKESDGYNVYLGDTLRCDGIDLPIVKVKEDEKVD